MSDTTDPAGSLAEEARRLADALGGPAAATSEGHQATCTWCPLCRGVDSLRAVDPAAIDRLAAAVSALAGALGDISQHLREQFAPGVGGAPAPNAGGDRTAYDIPVSDEED